MKNLAILQARMQSSRLPGKVLKLLNGRPMIEWQIRRIQSSSINRIVLATSEEESDDELAEVVSKLDIEVFRGSLDDVHSRYLRILQDETPDYFIRLTGDCPVVMPRLIDEMILEFEKNRFEYFSNVNPPTFPDGLDIEIVSTNSFFEFSKFELTDSEKEHVTLGIRSRSSQFKAGNFLNTEDLSGLRWTVDYEGDFQFITSLFNSFEGRELEFTMNEILELIHSGSLIDNPISSDFRNLALRTGELSE
jgi:spore coat polysaccharide biosynthesis protein SpsF (cytidylyltransferase family)